MLDLREGGFDIGAALTTEVAPPCASLQGVQAMTDLDTSVVVTAVALLS